VCQKENNESRKGKNMNVEITTTKNNYQDLSKEGLEGGSGDS